MRSCSRRNSSLKLLHTGGNQPSDARRFKYHCCLPGNNFRAACVVRPQRQQPAQWTAATGSGCRPS
eukprot:203648-Chlamydomonas_euryale.AAC.1